MSSNNNVTTGLLAPLPQLPPALRDEMGKRIRSVTEIHDDRRGLKTHIQQCLHHMEVGCEVERVAGEQGAFTTILIEGPKDKVEAARTTLSTWLASIWPDLPLPKASAWITEPSSEPLPHGKIIPTHSSYFRKDSSGLQLHDTFDYELVSADSSTFSVGIAGMGWNLQRKKVCSRMVIHSNALIDVSVLL
jgi:hypothetical protein